MSFTFKIVFVAKTEFCISSCWHPKNKLFSRFFFSVSFVQSHSCIHEFLWMIINKWTRASRNWTNERRTIIFTYEKKNLRMIFFFFLIRSIQPRTSISFSPTNIKKNHAASVAVCFVIDVLLAFEMIK